MRPSLHKLTSAATQNTGKNLVWPKMQFNRTLKKNKNCIISPELHLLWRHNCWRIQISQKEQTDCYEVWEQDANKFSFPDWMLQKDGLPWAVSATLYIWPLQLGDPWSIGRGTVSVGMMNGKPAGVNSVVLKTVHMP